VIPICSYRCSAQIHDDDDDGQYGHKGKERVMSAEFGLLRIGGTCFIASESGLLRIGGTCFTAESGLLRIGGTC
jgi:hypothetical protein